MATKAAAENINQISKGKTVANNVNRDFGTSVSLKPDAGSICRTALMCLLF